MPPSTIAPQAARRGPRLSSVSRPAAGSSMQHELRAGRQRPGDADELALALGQLAGHPVGEVRDAEHVERLVDAVAVPCRRGGRGRRGSRAADWRSAADLEVLVDGEVVEQLERLPGPAEAEPARRWAAAPSRSRAVEADRARSTGRSR